MTKYDAVAILDFYCVGHPGSLSISGTQGFHVHNGGKNILTKLDISKTYSSVDHLQSYSDYLIYENDFRFEERKQIVAINNSWTWAT